MSLALALLDHYIEYLSAPGVLATVALIVAPLFFTIYKDVSPASSKLRTDSLSGCRRFGLPDGRSNLKDQFSQSAPINDGQRPRVKALFTYPIKSCRGIELPASEIESTGLRYDRMFTFAQLHTKPAPSNSPAETSSDGEQEWRFITARELPRLALVKTELWVPDMRKQAPIQSINHTRNISDDSTEISKSRSRSRKGTVVLESAGIDAERRRKLSVPSIASDWASNGGCLIISFPYQPDFNPIGLRTETVTIRIPLAPTPERAEAKMYTSEAVTVWKDRPQATNISNEIDPSSLEKLRRFLGVRKPLALFKRDDTRLRPVTRNLPQDLADGRFEIGFSDSYCAHILNLASVRALDANLPASANMKHRLDARRFRANIYIDGAPAFEEDGWRRAALGRCIQPRMDFEGNGRGRSATSHARGVAKAEFLFGCGTSRCTLPNVDPDTGMKDKNEPYGTLMRTRKTRGEEPGAAFLGMQVLPLVEYGILSVGDEVDVLEREGDD
ncbi:hypothetical protein WHR41_07760 [Cladosporium halotolerans]|uniref:MOSC domain-containing protein n=1 Tax=Cladosporium halotolerans TaxID=1052096 RepID=A0AB34KJX7_9PEZI